MSQEYWDGHNSFHYTPPQNGDSFQREEWERGWRAQQDAQAERERSFKESLAQINSNYNNPGATESGTVNLAPLIVILPVLAGLCALIGSHKEAITAVASLIFLLLKFAIIGYAGWKINKRTALQHRKLVFLAIGVSMLYLVCISDWAWYNMELNYLMR